MRNDFRGLRHGPALALSFSLLCNVANAQPGGGSGASSAQASATAESLFREGRSLSDAGNYEAACEKYAASYSLEPVSGTLINLADCHEKLGKTASAWAEFLKVAADSRAAGRADREKVARERARTLEPRLMRLKLNVPEAARVAGMTIKRNGALVEPAAWGSPIPTDPGAHELLIEAPGKLPRTLSSVLDEEGATVEVLVEPLDDAPVPVEAPTNVPEPEPEPVLTERTSASPEDFTPPDDSTQRTLGLALGIVGAAGVGVGSVLGVMAMSRWDDATAAGCGDGRCPTPESQKNAEDAGALATGSTLGLAGGGALIVTGAVLYLLAPEPDRSALQLQPQVSESELKLSVGGSF